MIFLVTKRVAKKLKEHDLINFKQINKLVGKYTYLTSKY